MQQTSDSRTGALLVGALLIVIGIGAIVVRQTGIELSWPAWVILPGIALFLAAFAVPIPGGAGLATAGSIVTIVGVVLAFQQATGAWSTWSYAWALVAPGGAGLGLFLYGLLTRRGEIARGGFGALATGLVLFLVFFVFFEGVVRLNDGRFGEVTASIVPGAIVVIGVIVLLGALIPGPWRRPRTASDGWTAWAAPGGAAAGASASPSGGARGGASNGRAGGQAGDTTGSVPGAAAGAGSAGEVVDLPLAGAADAEVRIVFGAGRLFVGAAQPGKLADGTCSGGVSLSAPAPGRLRLAAPHPSWNWSWNSVPFEWRVGLTGEVPLRLEVETGASDSTLDLSLLRVTDLRLRTGAAQATVTLPAAAGSTRVAVETGAAQLRFRIPDGVAARIRSTMALGSTDVDTARFPRSADGGGWASPGFEGAANRVEIEIRGGAGQVSVG